MLKHHNCYAVGVLKEQFVVEKVMALFLSVNGYSYYRTLLMKFVGRGFKILYGGYSFLCSILPLYANGNHYKLELKRAPAEFLVGSFQLN